MEQDQSLNDQNLKMETDIPILVENNAFNLCNEENNVKSSEQLLQQDLPFCEPMLTTEIHVDENNTVNILEQDIYQKFDYVQVSLY